MSNPSVALPLKRPHLDSDFSDSCSSPARRVRPRLEPATNASSTAPPALQAPPQAQTPPSDSDPESSADVSSLITSEDSDSDSRSEISIDNPVEDGVEREEDRRTPLRARVTDFLARLRETNGEVNGGGFELGDGEEVHVGEGGEAEGDGPYIEMELGLGVLEEMVEGRASGSEDGDDDDDEELDVVSGEQDGVAGWGRPCNSMLEKKRRGDDILGKLMGRKGRVRRAKITEIDDG